MLTAAALESEFNEVLRADYGVEGEKNGLLIGSPRTPVSAMTFCWSPTAEVLAESVRRGAQAVFAHEIPFVPVYKSAWWPRPDEQAMPANVARRQLYDRHGLALLQYHSPLDGWPIWGTPRALADALGLDPAAASWPNRFLPVLDVPERSLGALARRVRDRLGLTGVGLSERPERPVRRAALAVGGFGAGWSISEVARAGGADVMIVGELSDYTVRAAREAGIAVIQASHYATENPAVRRLAEVMADRLAGRVRCSLVETGSAWGFYGLPLD